MAVASTFTAFTMIFYITIMAISIGVVICKIIGQWKIFEKAGEEGWKAIIPVYNTYILCQITGTNPYWLIVVFAGAVLSAVPGLNLLYSAIAIYFAILLGVNLSRAFGKEDAYAIGLILLRPVFYAMLGFDKSKYVGKKPMKDIVFEDWFHAENPAYPEGKQAVKYCGNCGEKFTGNPAFCPKCGKKVK